MYKKNKLQTITVLLLLVIFTLACASVQVGIVTPSPESAVEPIGGVQTLSPDANSEANNEIPEDFSHLWVEYWNPVFNYGLAIPAHWQVETESQGGFMMLWSYEQEFFEANSIKGWWIGGEAPEGVVKLDFVPFENVVPEQSLDIAISNILGADPEMTVVLAVEKIDLGNFDAVQVTTARPDNDLDDTTTSIAIRLSPDVILLVAAYPDNFYELSDVKTILGSLVLNKNTPIIKPTTAPHPPLTVKNQDLSGMPTASYPVAWYGHIASLPAAEFYDDKVTLGFGAGEFGIKGSTPELEEEIQSLRDATGEAEYLHLWGVLYCNIDDYNTCQLSVDRLEYGDQYSMGLYDIGDWVGTIKSTTYNGETTYVFELSGGVPVWYGISGNNDSIIQGEIEALSDTDTIVTIWGDLLVGVDGVNGTRIDVRMIDPPGPNMMPSPTSCDSESGYLGSVEEMVEFIKTNLETGNHWPFSYAIGNPFVIGYWLSEGVVLPREEAYQQLTTDLLPSPDNAVVITDPALFPDLGGRSLETIWGPDVDVAATIYSKGWGSDGQQEAILSVARCDSNGQDVYYWYGMMYGRFVRNE